MYEDAAYNPYGVTGNPACQKRMNYFNIARGLFPYSSPGTDSKPVDVRPIDVREVIEAAKALQAFVEGENA